MALSTPRHCLFFVLLHSAIGEGYGIETISQQFQKVETTSLDDILEPPPLHVTYGIQGATSAFRTSLRKSPPSSLEEKDAIGETLLFKAVRQSDLSLGMCVRQVLSPALIDTWGLVQQLLEYNACATQRNRHGNTCIAVACAMGNLAIVRCLLDHGADPMVGNFWRPCADALSMAVRWNRHAVLEYLITHLPGIARYDLTLKDRVKHVSLTGSVIPA